jgi:hypothetical protein
MFRPIFAVVLIVGTLVMSGCRKKEQCAAGDSPAVCEGFQECLRSNVATTVCRQAETDATQIQNSKPHADTDSGDALKH